MFLAECFDDAMGLFQISAWHAGEQVMLDLIIESTIPEVIKGARGNITGRYHLAAQEIHLCLFLQNRHTLVVRREG